MPDPKNIALARELLKEGKVQEADALLEHEETEAAGAAAAAAAKPIEPPPPRPPGEILVDIITEIVDHLGNKGKLEELLAELIAASK